MGYANGYAIEYANGNRVCHWGMAMGYGVPRNQHSPARPARLAEPAPPASLADRHPIMSFSTPPCFSLSQNQSKSLPTSRHRKT